MTSGRLTVRAAWWAPLAVVAASLALARPVTTRSTAGAPWPVSLVDVADRAGLTVPTVYGGLERKRFIIETNGCGVALLDVDEDGWLDAFLLNGTRLAEGSREDASWPAGEAPTSRLYKNNRDGTFSDITARSGIARTGWGSSVCAGDYDNDGRVDLFVTYYGQNVLYRNLGGGRFDDVTDAVGLPTGGRRWGSGCSFLDYDRDGRLDLFVANYLAFDVKTAPEPGAGANCLWKGIPVNCGPKGLPTDTNLLYRNTGDRFVDVSAPSGIAGVTGRYPMTAIATDLDSDGWTDIYVASDSTAAILYRNNGNATFTDTAVESGAAYSEQGAAQAGMGAAAGDFNADGRLDLLKTHFADDVPALYRALGKGLFEDVAMASGLGVENRHVEWGAALPDLDNDGLADVFYVTGNVYPEVERVLAQYPHRGPRIVFRNVNGERFENVSGRSGPGASARHSSRGAAFGDIDNDGDIDVLIMNMNEPPSLLRNDSSSGHGWLTVRLQGTSSNRSAIGAIVRVTAGGRTQARPVLSQSSYYSHDDLRVHVGLGATERVDAIEVQWPNGQRETVRDVAARRMVTILEGKGIR